MSWSASSKPTAARKPKRCSRSRSLPRKRIDYQGHDARGDGPRRAARPAAATRPGRRTGAYQRAGQPPPQTLSGRRGIARRRHRRLYRRSTSSTSKASTTWSRQITRMHGARDRARFVARPRRRDRTDRPVAGRPAPAAEGRQGLCPGAGRARAGAFFLAGQPDGAARAGAAPHGRAGRRAVAQPICRPTPSQVPGPRASACWSASAKTRARPGWSVTPSGWRTGCTRNGRRSASRRGAACN